MAPDVQTSSFGSQWTSAATSSRASSTAASVSQPNACERDAGLPKCSVRYGNHLVPRRADRPASSRSNRGRSAIAWRLSKWVGADIKRRVAGSGDCSPARRCRWSCSTATSALRGRCWRTSSAKRHRAQVTRRCGALSPAHSSCVMQRRSSRQFSRAAALRRVDRLVDGDDDVGDRHASRARDRGCSRRPDRARCRPGRCRRSLPNSCSRYDSEIFWRSEMAASVTGPLRAVQRDVDHRRHGEPSFGGQAHEV